MSEHEHTHRSHHNMSNTPGTLRGATPKRAQVPFESSPSTSSIPRPRVEATNSSMSEMSGHSTISASRQKQSRRDEVCRKSLVDTISYPGAGRLEMDSVLMVSRPFERRLLPTSIGRRVPHPKHGIPERHHLEQSWP